ncbi:MAG: 5,10-methylenetetrahydromethanopterin reductase [Patiriisocius sp.]|jgi:5,10-methylenetetrahydromethanopterin reductase
MRIGWNGTGIVGHASLESVTKDMQRAQANGFASYWLADHPTGGFDALTALAIGGQDISSMEIGTAVIPTFPRNPMALAAQALTVAQSLKVPFCLGVGLSHESMMKELGIAFEKPIRHLREYLSILVPLLEEGEVDFDGELLSCHAKIFKRPMPEISVVVAALGPQALKVAGQFCSGTTLAWVGPKTVKEHIAPRIQDAASAAGRSSPRIISTLPVCITTQGDARRKSISQNFASYGELPSYRAMFDREGAAGPGDVALVGSPSEVKERLEILADAGVTDFGATAYAESPEEKSNTLSFLAELSKGAI